MVDESDVQMEAVETEISCLHSEEQKTSYSWYEIDCGMVSSKLSYFFQSAKDSCILPYMMLFLTAIGLSPEQAGQINGLRFLGFIIGAPLWGILADYKQLHRVVIFVLCTASFLLITSQPFLSIPLSDSYKCERQGIRHQTSNQSLIINNTTMTSTTRKVIARNNSLFVMMMVMNLLASCFDGSIQGFVDSGVIQKVNTRQRKTEFGMQRPFGAIGYGFGTFISSIAVEYFNSSNLPCFTSVFIIYGCFILCLNLCTYLLFRRLSFSEDKKRETVENGALENQGKLSFSEDKKRKTVENGTLENQDTSVGKILRITVCKPSTLFFLITVLVIGTIHSVYISFLFVLLKEIDCPNVVMGISIAIGSVTSVICFRLSEFIIKMVGGAMRVLCIGSFSWAIRFLFFSYMKNPWVVLPIQLLQGLGFGLFIGSSLIHIRGICSPVVYSSMYGIFNGLFFGAGQIIGNLTVGTLLMTYDIRRVFLATSISGFIWTFVMFIYLMMSFKKKKVKKHCSLLSPVDDSM